MGRRTNTLLVGLVWILTACHDEPALPGGPCVADCWGPSPRSSLDGGEPGMDGSTFVLLGDDAGATVDGGAMDSSMRDGGTAVLDRDGGDAARDAGPASPDAGMIRDAGPPRDAGFGPVAPGTYVYRRLPVLSSQTELTHVAIAPDGLTMLVAERYSRVHVIALPAETLVRTVVLPRVASELVSVTGMRYAPDGRAVVLTVTAYHGSTVSGRVMQMGPRGEQPTGKGPLFSSVMFEGLDEHPDGGDRMQIVARTQDGQWLRMYHFDVDQSAPVLDGQAAVTSGCQDVAPVDDGAGGRTSVYSCGINGGAVGQHVGGTTFVPGPSVTNTAHVASRPQRDYALFVSWAAGRLARFESGQYTTGSAAPDLGSIDLWDIAFSDDGQRALITGEMISGTAQLREYRHDAYDTAGLSDVSIAAFDQAPWLGLNGVVLLEAAWRPGGDCGYVVGGCSISGCARGYLVHFEVANGRACP